MRRLMQRFAAAASLAVGFIAAPVGVTAAPGDAGFAYSTLRSDVGCSLVKIDLATAEVIEYPGLTPSESACVADLAVAPDGTPWGVLGREIGDINVDGLEGVAEPSGDAPDAYLVQFDPDTGEVVSDVRLAQDAADGPSLWVSEGGIAVNAAGVFIHAFGNTCVDGTEICLFEVDPATGIATAIGSSTAYTLFFLADCDGLITASSDEGSLVLTDVSATTGARSNPRPTGGLYGFDCAGDQKYALELPQPVQAVAQPQVTQLALVTLDPASGATNLVAAIDPSSADLWALALPPQQVPSTTTTTTGGGSNTGNNNTNTGTGAVNAQPRFAG